MPKISATTPLATATRAPRSVNEFVPVIAQFAEGTHLVTPDTGETLSTLLNHLREAARTINKSVSINWLNAAGEVVPNETNPATGKMLAIPTKATQFKFQLRELITRKPKDTAEAATAPVEAAPVKGKGK